MPVITRPNSTFLVENALQHRDISKVSAYSVLTYLSLYTWPRVVKKRLPRNDPRMPPSHQQDSDLKEHSLLWPLKNTNVTITLMSPRVTSIADTRLSPRDLASSSITGGQAYASTESLLNSSTHSNPHNPKSTNGYSTDSKIAIQLLVLAILFSFAAVAGLAIYKVMTCDDYWDKPHPLLRTRRKLASRLEAASHESDEEEYDGLPWPPGRRRRPELAPLVKPNPRTSNLDKCVLNRPKYMPSPYGACGMGIGAASSLGSSTEVDIGNGHSRTVSPANSKSSDLSARSAGAKSMTELMKWACKSFDDSEEFTPGQEEVIIRAGGRDCRCITISMDLHPITIGDAPAGAGSSRHAISERTSEDSRTDADRTSLDEQQRLLLQGSNRGRRIRASISET